MTRFKTGGVYICWHCDRQLVRKNKAFIFALIEDPIGNQMRVHKDCVKFAIGGGYKEVPEQVDSE